MHKGSRGSGGQQGVNLGVHPKAGVLSFPSSWLPPTVCLKVGGTGQGLILLLAPSDYKPREGKTPVCHVSAALLSLGVSTEQGYGEGSEMGGGDWNGVGVQLASSQ